MSTSETQPEIVGFRLSPQQEPGLESGTAGTIVQCAARVQRAAAEDLREALAQAVARHEILRTTFVRPTGVRDRQQVIHDDLPAAWREEHADVDALAADPATLSELLARERQPEFDIEHGPLLRALLLTPSAHGAAAVLVLSAHAAVADPRSLLLLLGELLGGGEQPGEPIQYADYAEWRHEFVTGDDSDAADGRAWWQADARERRTAPRLPFAAPGPALGPGAVAVPISSEMLLSAAEAQRVPPAVLLEACWHATLARLTGESDLLGAGWLDGREQPDLDQAIGAYAQPVPVRTRVEAGTTFAEVLDQIRRGRAEATRRQDYGTAADQAALIQAAAIGFVHVEPLGSPQSILAIRPPQVVPLLLVSRGDGSGSGSPSAELQFSGASLSLDDAYGLAGRIATLLSSAAADVTQTVAQLAILEPAERDRLIAAAAGPPPAADAATPVHHRFERRAALTPEQPAVAGAGAELSYRDLNASANRVAHLLKASGVGRGDRVGLCLERTPALLQGLLGILKAGAAYVPLNFEHPPARVAHQLGETGSRVLLTEASLLDRLPPFDGVVVCLDRDRARIDEQSEADPDRVSEPEDLAYVMYTSGSTGLPKGVMVTHGNLANYSAHIAERLGAEGSRFGVVSAISTDLGNTCIFPALVGGGCVQLISTDGAMDGDAMAAELGGDGLDVLKVAPSHLQALLASGGAALPRRWLVVGGEALSWDLAARIRELSPDLQLLNHYGPTEATVGCCAYEVGERRTDAATVPIGRPLAGARAYVLDRELEPVPPGVAGELCIAGAGVAAGYVGTATDDADPSGPFVVADFSGAPERMYRTGDRVRVLPDGAIEFLGRIDDQVKIRGFRIEPAEVETVLGRHPAVRQAAVVPEADDRGELRLVAYISASGDPTVEDIQAFLSESLPEYMVPGSFAQLDSLPFTPSGKIDRQALAGLAAVQIRREAQYVGPRDAIEEQIAGIWADLLGAEQVGVFDDFFALGGHSLLATQAIMRIRRQHADIPLRALLAAPTVATLAEVVRGGPVAE